MLVIMRFVNLYQGSFSYCHIFYYFWVLKNNSLLYRRILLSRGPIPASKFIIGPFQSHQSDAQ